MQHRSGGVLVSATRTRRTISVGPCVASARADALVLPVWPAEGRQRWVTSRRSRIGAGSPRTNRSVTGSPRANTGLAQRHPHEPKADDRPLITAELARRGRVSGPSTQRSADSPYDTARVGQCVTSRQSRIGAGSPRTNRSVTGSPRANTAWCTKAVGRPPPTTEAGRLDRGFALSESEHQDGDRQDSGSRCVTDGMRC